MDNLTTLEKIGQLFLVGTNKKEELPFILELIKTNKIGGVVLYKSNYSNYEEFINLINSFKEANKNNKIPLFISIDQEGGRVNRLPKEINVIKNAFAFNKASDDLIKKRTNITTDILNKSGINMNFNPVLDLKFQKDRHAIGNRAFSNDPKEVSRITNIIIDEYNKYNVIPVIKHFPGQGSLKRDSHINMPYIKEYKAHSKLDLIPFKNAIKNDVSAIMVGHIRIKGYTGLYPATLSKNFIQKELRNNLNFNNLVVTDELSMRSVRYLYGRKFSIIKTINAGCDIIMYKYFNDLNKIFNVLEKKINSNKLNDSVERILKIKNKYNVNDNLIINNLDINKININIDNINKEVE